MKTITRILFLSLTLGLMTMCNKDDDPGTFCEGGLCDNAALKQECIDKYNDCKTVDNGSDEECKAIGLTVCNL
jgi:hypothetical protein